MSRPWFECEHKLSYRACENRSNRGSHRRCSVKKVVYKNFVNFAGKHSCWSFFLIKLQAILHRCFPVKFVKFVRTSANDCLLTKQMSLFCSPVSCCFLFHELYYFFYAHRSLKIFLNMISCRLLVSFLLLLLHINKRNWFTHVIDRLDSLHRWLRLEIN